MPPSSSLGNYASGYPHRAIVPQVILTGQLCLSPAEKKGKVSERERFLTLSEFYVNFASEIFPNRAFPKISDSFPNVPVTRSEAF